MDPRRLKYPEIQSAALRMADMAITNTGVLVLDTALQVLSANQAARQMVACADALNITAGQLRAIRNTDDARLKEVCRSLRVAMETHGTAWCCRVAPASATTCFRLPGQDSKGATVPRCIRHRRS
jgi:hypothetical protein